MYSIQSINGARFKHFCISCTKQFSRMNSWNIANEYPSLSSKEITDDLQKAESLISEIRRVPAKDYVSLSLSKEIFCELDLLLRNVSAYTRCILAVDIRHKCARDMLHRTNKLSSFARQLLPDDLPTVEFKSLTRSEIYLSPEHHRDIVESLVNDGHSAWTRIYDELSRCIPFQMGGHRTNLTQIAVHLSSGERETRMAAWAALQAGWEAFEEPAATALNSIIGWRVQLVQNANSSSSSVRTHSEDQHTRHFLDPALRKNRLSRETLHAMMSVVDDAKVVGQRALRLQSRWMGIPAAHPCDLLAPPPLSASPISLAEAMSIILEAVKDVHPSAAEFIRLVTAERWLDVVESGSEEGLSGRAADPTVIMFPLSGRPRVFLPVFDGSPQSVSLLAHYLGHAYHLWVLGTAHPHLRDCPESLSEIAAVLFEQAVKDRLCKNSSEYALHCGWMDAENAVLFLLDLPTRFSLDMAAHESRSRGEVLTAVTLRCMSADAWRSRFGTAMCTPDELLWAHKKKFFLTDTQFYNFPYTFSFLFAHAVRSRVLQSSSSSATAAAAPLGSSSTFDLVQLLLDTGHKSAKQLIDTYLSDDVNCSTAQSNAGLNEASFWLQSVSMVDSSLDEFEKALENARI